MVSPSTLDRVPAHLRHYVVQQDYAEYTAADQAVWRFVLLQLYSRLRQTAHPAYADGLGRSGMSVDRIPAIAEMDRRLSEVGWGAVCVDGFIPPRAFVEFQSLGILPIAAEIRTRQHLAYTPAPDIIHEAAGHAPILPEPAYADYLRRIGVVGARAFSVAADERAYQAIYRLSELKEDPGADPRELLEAERAVEQALARTQEVSEAAQVARLYWWTVEYGLMGTPKNYRLYGAGLLSSLGESHFCHRPEVKKVPLEPGCVQVGYDITRQQPQLFVARDFDHLNLVLEAVAQSLAHRIGGKVALERAAQSGEVATVELDSGAQIIGRLAGFEGRGGVTHLRFEGETAIACADRLLPGPRAASPWLVVGRLRDGRGPGGIDPSELARRAEAGRLELEWADGTCLRGQLGPIHQGPRGAVAVSLTDASVELASGKIWRPTSGELVVPLGSSVHTAFAGAADAAYWPSTEFSRTRVPKARSYPPEERALLELFQRLQSIDPSGVGAASSLSALHQALQGFSGEWLLRWALLERALAAGAAAPLVAALATELEQLELRYGGEQPIASGLKHLLGERAAPA